ncbi:hypothetical protein BJV74DRAFT_840806 [Russula compacta]|nr:hypothetical protein BJV74DRAFT_840806 [Russula compacta]
MRKRIVAFVRWCLVHLEQATVRIATSSTSRPSARVDAVTLCYPCRPRRSSSLHHVLEDLLATIEQHVKLGVVDDAAFTRSQHNLDVFAFELEQLRGHFRDSLPCLTSLGTAADWPLEFAWEGTFGDDERLELAPLGCTPHDLV